MRWKRVHGAGVSRSQHFYGCTSILTVRDQVLTQGVTKEGRTDAALINQASLSESQLVNPLPHCTRSVRGISVIFRVFADLRVVSSFGH